MEVSYHDFRQRKYQKQEREQKEGEKKGEKKDGLLVRT
jgi:hypothetical protein